MSDCCRNIMQRFIWNIGLFWSVNSWILISCQPLRVTAGQNYTFTKHFAKDKSYDVLQQKLNGKQFAKYIIMMSDNKI